MNPVCCEEDCTAPAAALLVVLSDLLGRTVAATIYPLAAPLGSGGLPICAEHLHGLIDEALMDAQPPPTPPALESAP